MRCSLLTCQIIYDIILNFNATCHIIKPLILSQEVDTVQWTQEAILTLLRSLQTFSELKFYRAIMRKRYSLLNKEEAMKNVLIGKKVKPEIMAKMVISRYLESQVFTSRPDQKRTRPSTMHRYSKAQFKIVWDFEV